MSARRLWMGITALAVIPIGLFIRFLPLGLFADLAGGVLYAVLIYLLVGWLTPHWKSSSVALCAIGWCFVIEFLQLSAFPAFLAAEFPPARLVFGTGFAALDLLAYALGVGLVCVIDRHLRFGRRSAV